MAINFPGPWECRFFYTITNAGADEPHQMNLSFDVDTVSGNIGDPFTSWIPIDRDGNAAVNLDTFVDAMVTAWRDLLNADLTIVRVELWKYVVGTFNADWYSTKAVNLAGIKTTDSIINSQQIYTFRTTQGGVMRNVLMEHGIQRGPTQVLPLGNADYDVWADRFLLGSNIWRGRDNGYPIAFLGFHPGENERLFKKRNR